MTPAQRATLTVLAGRGAHARAQLPYNGHWWATHPGPGGSVRKVSGANVALLLAHGWVRCDRWGQILITPAGRAALRGSK